MAEIIQIKTAAYAIGTSPQILQTLGIGSCVAVCIYDKVKKTGTLLHFMLPESGDTVSNPFLFANLGIPFVLNELIKQNSRKEDLEAKLIGGANMFINIKGNFVTLGERNIEKAKQILQSNNIPVQSTDTGGNNARSLDFFLDTGIIEVRTKL